MMGAKILLVEDDPRMVRLVSVVLKAVGHQVVASSTGHKAVEMVAMEQPSLVLLDVLLAGDMDGFSVCRRVREFSDVPIIMLTARAREADVLTGFDAGADDYLTKPFNSRELVARVKAVLRRAEHPEEVTTESLVCRSLEIDYARRLVKVHGRPVALTPTEYKLLLELAKNANRVLLHRDLLTRVWGPEYRDDIDYLRAYIRHLRRKLEPDPSDPCYIITHPGVGYMLECDPQ
jgi:two-component system KDP operon response regulator KdpE